MKDKLLAALKTKFKNLGFGDKAFDGVADYLSKTVTEENQIETAISGVEGLLKAFQGDIDKVRGEKTELQKKFDELEKKNKPADPNPNDPKPDPDEPAWFKAYREKQEAEQTALKQEIEGFKKKETQSGYTAKLKAALKEKNIPESYFSKRNLVIESDEQLQTVSAEIESDYTTFKQEMVNAGVMIDIPVNSGGEAKAGEALAKNIAEKRNTNASEGVKGKEI